MYTVASLVPRLLLSVFLQRRRSLSMRLYCCQKEGRSFYCFNSIFSFLSHFLILTPTPLLPSSTHLSLSLSPSSRLSSSPSSSPFSLFPFLRSYQQRIHHYRILRNEEGLLSIQVESSLIPRLFLPPPTWPGYLVR